MNYQEQLLDNNWQRKRIEVIVRDQDKCQNCFNVSFEKNFERGLILSNKLSEAGVEIESKDFEEGVITTRDLKFSNNIVQGKTKYISRIWNLQKDKIETGFIDTPIFDPNQTYMVFYQSEGKYAKLLAMRKLDENRVGLNNNVLDIIDFGLKGKFTEETYQETYRPVSEKDTWEDVFGLHVHHKYYQRGKLAWEYPDEALVTLCWSCHEDLHENTSVPAYDENGGKIGVLIPCERCYGAGVFPEYDHVQSGICFRCNGARYEEMIE